MLPYDSELRRRPETSSATKDFANAVSVGKLVILKTPEPLIDRHRMKRIALAVGAMQTKDVLLWDPGKGVVENWETHSEIAAAKSFDAALIIGSQYQKPHMLLVGDADLFLSHQGIPSPDAITRVNTTINLYRQRPQTSEASLVLVITPGSEIPPIIRQRGFELHLQSPSTEEMAQVFKAYQSQNPHTPFNESQMGELINQLRGTSDFHLQDIIRRSIKLKHCVDLRSTLEVATEVKRKAAEDTELLRWIDPRKTFRPSGCDFFLDEYLSGLRRNGAFVFGSGIRPRLLLFVGPPGTGKSALAERTSTEAGVDGFWINAQQMHARGGNYGGGGAALELILETLGEAGAIGIIDEFNRLLAHDPTGGTDAGTSARIYGGLLTAIQEGGERTIIGTINNVMGLDPAILRPGRLTAAFWIGPMERDGLLGVAYTHLSRRSQRLQFRDLSRQQVAKYIADMAVDSGSPALVSQIVENLAARTSVPTLSDIQCAFSLVPTKFEDEAGSPQERAAWARFRNILPDVSDGLRPEERSRKQKSWETRRQVFLPLLPEHTQTTLNGGSTLQDWQVK